MFIKSHEFDLPPSADIDEVWNRHILFTRHYTSFTENLFGKYLNHHIPHSSSKLEGRKIIEQNFLNATQPLYYQEFGTYLYKVRSYPILDELKRIILKYFFKEPTNE
jgi:hypothetical protein